METTASLATKDNVQLMKQAINYFLTGNIQGILDMCTDDVRWESFKAPGAHFTELFLGKEGLQEYFSLLARDLDFTVFETDDYVAQGDRVLVLGHNMGTVRPTGKAFSNKFCLSFKLEEGKVKEYFGYIDSYDIYRLFQP